MGFIWCVDIFSIALWIALSSFVYRKFLTSIGAIILLIGAIELHQRLTPESMLVAVFEAAREGTRTGLKEFVPPKMETVEQLAKTEPPKPIPKESRGEKDQPEPQKKTIVNPKMEGKISKPVEKPIQEVPPRVEEKTVDSKREPIKIQPDIAVRLVSRKELTVALLNVSPPGILVTDPKFTIVIWNLDLPDRDEPIPDGRLITKTFDRKWIRQEETFIVLRFTRVPEIAALIKTGDRLFGWIAATCPDCVKTKTYWIYTIHGQGGWYSELPQGKFPQLNKVKELLPQIRENPETFFADIPKESRISIEDLL